MLRLNCRKKIARFEGQLDNLKSYDVFAMLWGREEAPDHAEYSLKFFKKMLNTYGNALPAETLTWRHLSLVINNIYVDRSTSKKSLDG